MSFSLLPSYASPSVTCPSALYIPVRIGLFPQKRPCSASSRGGLKMFGSKPSSLSQGLITTNEWELGACPGHGISSAPCHRLRCQKGLPRGQKQPILGCKRQDVAVRINYSSPVDSGVGSSRDWSLFDHTAGFPSTVYLLSQEAFCLDQSRVCVCVRV